MGFFLPMALDGLAGKFRTPGVPKDQLVNQMKVTGPGYAPSIIIFDPANPLASTGLGSTAKVYAAA